MYKKLLIILVLTFGYISFSYAQNWGDDSQLNLQSNTEITIEPTTTTFSVEIPNNNVDLVTASLCYSTDVNFDMDKCNGDVSKKVVIEFIKEKVDAYVKSQVKSTDINIQ